jgi:hypothetical protein
MYIHKLGKSLNGGRMSKGHSKQHTIAKNHKRLLGSGLSSAIYDNNKLTRKSDLLKNLKITTPRIPKKYISFDL